MYTITLQEKRKTRKKQRKERTKEKKRKKNIKKKERNKKNTNNACVCMCVCMCVYVRVRAYVCVSSGQFIQTLFRICINKSLDRKFLSDYFVFAKMFRTFAQEIKK